MWLPLSLLLPAAVGVFLLLLFLHQIFSSLDRLGVDNHLLITYWLACLFAKLLACLLAQVIYLLNYLPTCLLACLLAYLLIYLLKLILLFFLLACLLV